MSCSLALSNIYFELYVINRRCIPEIGFFTRFGEVNYRYGKQFGFILFIELYIVLTILTVKQDQRRCAFLCRYTGFFFYILIYIKMRIFPVFCYHCLNVLKPGSASFR